MDKLDQEISQKRAEVQSLRDQLRVLEIEIGALERAAALRPRLGPVSAEDSDPVSLTTLAVFHDPAWQETTENEIISPTTGRVWRAGKGRQPGAISAKWRGVLQQIYRAGQATVDEICEMASSDPGAVRQRMLLFISLHYVKSVGVDVYLVTEHAARRFGMVKGLSIEDQVKEFMG